MKRQREETTISVKRANNSGASRPANINTVYPVSAASRLTTSDALTYLREVKARFAHDKHIYDTFLEIMKDFKAQKVDTAGVIVKVKDLFKGHRELILGFNTFLPKGYEITMKPEEDKKPVEFDQAISYVNKIKTRFAHDERVYKAFLEILNMYRKGQKTIMQVYDEVAVLFDSHKDLLTEFTYFLPDNTAPERQARMTQPAPAAAKRAVGARAKVGGRPVSEQGVLRNLHKRKSARRGEDYDEEDAHVMRSNLAKEMQFFERVKSKLRNREAYQDLLKTLNMFAQEITRRDEMLSMVHDIIGRMPDLMVAFNDFLQRCEAPEAEADSKAVLPAGRVSARDAAKSKTMTNAEKLASQPISELDVSAWPRCTTSYVQLPKDYPTFKCSGRTAELAPLLNDGWVSVTSGSEDYSFKHMRKNQYEEALFRCEDDRFELDMIIENGASTIRALWPHANALASMTPEAKTNWRLPQDTWLSAIHYRAVQRIYGENGVQMVKLLRENPAYAIPIVFKRLQQKDHEWRDSKDAVAYQWQSIYDANYHRSLDHRSFYFKQVDKRHLGAKGMLQEIKEVSEKQRQTDVGLRALSAAAPFSARLRPHLTYDYSERLVHEHCWTVVRWAILAIGSGDTASRMLRFYAGLVENFLGVPPRTPEELTALDEKDDKKSMGTDLEKAVGAAAKHRKKGRVAALVSAAADGAETDPESGATPAVSGAAPQKMDVDAGDDGAASKWEDGAMPMEEGADSEDAAEESLKIKSSIVVENPDEDEEMSSDILRMYARCKPVAPVTRSVALAGTPAAAGVDMEPEEQSLRVFYGNDTYYVLFRLHQYLFDRLRVAHTCAMPKPSFQRPGAREGDSSASEYADIHGQYMSMVHDLIEGNLESSTYEDRCRALLGTGSYVLFTLEKLVYKVVKQMQTLLSDELTHKLFELYQYEQARGEVHSDATYFTNAHVLLHEDSCFRFAAEAESKATIQLMEPDKTEVQPGIMEPGFADYLADFTSGTGSVDSAGKVFLLRNLPERRLPDSLAAAEAATADAVLVNGLECKLSCTTSKVSYVLDTEDTYQKLRKPSAAPSLAAAAAKSAKFGSWLESNQRMPPQPPPALQPIPIVSA